MTKRTALMLLFGAMMLFMIVATIQTCLQANLFKDWSRLAAEPWMVATLKDFYNNILLIFVWVAYKERSVISSVAWLVAFVLLGSIATSFYVLVQLRKLGPDEPVEHVLLYQKQRVEHA